MELKNLRKQIDEIDAQIVQLFGERMQTAAEIAAYKKQHNIAVLDAAREREVLARVAELAGADMQTYAISLFTLLFDLSRAYQSNLSREGGSLSESISKNRLPAEAQFPEKGVVACQGVEGAYSQQACCKLFPLPSIAYFRSFEGVFQAVESGLSQFGILPIENSSYGSVTNVYDLMQQHKFHIVRSVRLNVDHSLLALPGTKLADLREIISHEQALGQCSNLLASLPDIRISRAANTAEAAAELAASGRKDCAVIASAECAALYGLQVLQQHVQNKGNNQTRFICIAKEAAIYPGANRISLMVALPHQPGALYRLLARFSALGVNLSKLESRPIPGRDFEFLFYIDLEASVWSESILRLLDELALSCPNFSFLGCYSEV